MFEEFIQSIQSDYKKWKALKNELVSKSKTVNETLTSFQVIQNNLGNEIDLSQLETIIEEKHNEYSFLCSQLEEQAKEITKMKTTVKKALKDILDLYKMLNMDELEASDAATEAAKVLYDKFDNLQLRTDPPINNIFKDKERLELIEAKDVIAAHEQVLANDVSNETFMNVPKA
jgi:hypothetical protein